MTPVKTKDKVTQDLAPELPKGTAPTPVESGYIRIDQIREMGDNHRRELGDVSGLAQSMGIAGQLQPVVLTRNGSGFILAAGHRRLAAAKLLGWEEIFATIRPMQASERKAFMAIENLQREDLTPLEEAEAIQELLDLGLSVTDTAGISQKRIHARVGLLALPKEMQAALTAGDINLGEAQELCRLIQMPARLKAAWSRMGQSGWSAHAAVKEQLAEQEFGDACAKLAEKAKTEGWKVVPYKGYYGPEGCKSVGGYDGVPVPLAEHKKLNCHRVTLPQRMHDRLEFGHWCANPTSHPEYVKAQGRTGRTDPAAGKRAAESRARNKLIDAARASRRAEIRQHLVEHLLEPEARELVLAQRLAYMLEKKGAICDQAAALLQLPDVKRSDRYGFYGASPAFREWVATQPMAVALWVLEVAEMEALAENKGKISGAYLDSTELEEERLVAFYEWLKLHRYALQDGDVATIKHLGSRNSKLKTVLKGEAPATPKRKPDKLAHRREALAKARATRAERLARA